MGIGYYMKLRSDFQIHPWSVAFGVKKILSHSNVFILYNKQKKNDPVQGLKSSNPLRILNLMANKNHHLKCVCHLGCLIPV